MLNKRAHLTEIRTKEISDFIYRKVNLKSHADWWLGGTDEVKVRF